VIYLDHHAASPIVDEARAAMEHARDVAWANPASSHSPGRASRAVLDDARRRIASAVSVKPSQLVLTSGGSEACQLGVAGLGTGARRIVTTTIEHPAVARTVEHLERAGVEVVRVPVRDEPLEVDAIVRHLGEGVVVAIQWVNHEVGLVLPVEAVALACREARSRLFVDATQALGKVHLDLGALGASTVALASTKVGGPGGAGALVVGVGESIEPLLVGGGQEHGLRAGMPSVEAHAGFGAAASLLGQRLETMTAVGARRDRLERGLVALGAKVNAANHRRVATCTSVVFPGRRATILAASLDLEGVAVATGPACSSGVDAPSPTLLALYPDEPERASSTLRFSLGPTTRDDEVESALAAVERVLARAHVH